VFGPRLADDQELVALLTFVTARIREAERAAGGDPSLLADCANRRQLIDWATEIEELRTLGDVAAPLRPVGREVLQLLAERWQQHPDWCEVWRLS
jgi:hypothetical protein